MAHFAKIDENNFVLEVIVINNDIVQNLQFPESEPIGIEFCKSIYGENTIWKQTSYNNSFRKNYAGVGFLYRHDLDAFVPLSPYPSWVLNEATAQWDAPVPYPQDGNLYKWDENILSWVLAYESP